MSWVALIGAVEIGFVFALVAMGVYLSFRVLNFPDLTVDGSFPLGAAVAATLIVSGVPPVPATLAAMVAGAMAGLVTAWLNVRLGILHLLASILTMIALYSINLRIMGAPNVALLGETTIIDPAIELGALVGLGYGESVAIFFGLIALAALAIIAWFLGSEYGLSLRASGANPAMAAAQGVSTGGAVLVGMALSNSLVGLAGALFAQSQGSADVTMGVGVIVVGLAAVIIGESLVPSRIVWLALAGCILGSVIYRLVVALALNADLIGLQAQDLNLLTAVLVALALVIPARKKLRRGLGARRLSLVGRRR